MRPALRHLGDYQLLFRIASGGMAEVYAARENGDAGIRKLYALKRMLPHLGEDEAFVDMFLDEGKMAAHITSPHVVQTYDLGRSVDDSLYLVMEFVRGISLRRLVKLLRAEEQPMPVDIACALLQHVARGLHDAHEARLPTGEPLGIIHRDVSPHNILVGVDGRARLTDFGVARALQRRTTTEAGQVKGKLSYIAPEQLEGKVDRRTDVFALGIIGWELFAGKRLFRAETSDAMIERIRSAEIPPISQLRDDIPREISDVLARSLQRNPDARFGTALQFANALYAAHAGADAGQVSAFIKDVASEDIARILEGIESGLARDLEPRSAENSITHSTVVSRRLADEPTSYDERVFDAPDDATQTVRKAKRSNRLLTGVFIMTIVFVAVIVGALMARLVQ